MPYTTFSWCKYPVSTSTIVHCTSFPRYNSPNYQFFLLHMSSIRRHSSALYIVFTGTACSNNHSSRQHCSTSIIIMSNRAGEPKKYIQEIRVVEGNIH